MTTLEVLSEAQERGLSLIPCGDRLAVGPNELLTPDLVRVLREFKPALLPLLQTKGLTWTEFYPQALQGTIFFCADEQTRLALVEAGADEWRIYTKAELAVLDRKNRIAPFTRDELKKVHDLKRTFNARIAE
jgi:hypothetical protein